MLLLTGHGYRKCVREVVFSPDGAALASHGNDGYIRLWDLNSGDIRRVFMSLARDRPVLSFSPDGRSLLCNEFNSVIVWILAEPPRSIRLEDSTGLVRASFTPDGRTILGVGDRVGLSDRVRRWDTESYEMLGDGFALDSHPRCTALSWDGQTLAVARTQFVPVISDDLQSCRATYTHTVHLYDVTTGQRLASLQGFTRRVDVLAFTPDGRALAAISGPTLQVRDTATGNVRFRHKISSLHFQAVAVTPDGRCLLAAHNDGTVRLYDTRSWRERACYDWRIGRVTCLAVAPDGLRAAAGGRSGRIVVWDLDP